MILFTAVMGSYKLSLIVDGITKGVTIYNGT
jgi:hypothetical protein